MNDMSNLFKHIQDEVGDVITTIRSDGVIAFKDAATAEQRAAADALVQQWLNGTLTLPEPEDISLQALLTRIQALEAQMQSLAQNQA